MIILSISLEARRRTRSRLGQQLQSLVESNGLHSHTRPFCELAYLHVMSLNPKPRYRVKGSQWAANESTFFTLKV